MVWWSVDNKLTRNKHENVECMSPQRTSRKMKRLNVGNISTITKSIISHCVLHQMQQKSKEMNHFDEQVQKMLPVLVSLAEVWPDFNRCNCRTSKSHRRHFCRTWCDETTWNQVRLQSALLFWYCSKLGCQKHIFRWRQQGCRPAAPTNRSLVICSYPQMIAMHLKRLYRLWRYNVLPSTRISTSQATLSKHQIPCTSRACASFSATNAVQ